ncbi:amino acid adenylation domain-containing protein [Sinorhizobium meliloti]|nr:amino acid adenylation domain-containing protein [Sinorhizobium meliloti]
MPYGRWMSAIERSADRRCDFDILLREKYRHVVSLRDQSADYRPHGHYEFSIELEEVEGAGPRSIGRLRAEVLLSLHLLLDAYGYGSVTAMAVIDAFGSDCVETAKVFPSLINHSELAEKLCGDAVRELEADLSDGASYLSTGDILGRGYFDLVVVMADEESSMDLDTGPLGVILQFNRSTSRLSGRFVHSLEMIDRRVPESLTELLRAIFLQLVGHPRRRIAELELQSDADRRKVDAFNATEGRFATDTRLEELFEAAVRKTPDAIALRTDEMTLGYDQLNRRANRFALWLSSVAACVEAGQFVGLYMDKGSLPVITTMALWKAGASCVPIDPAHPIERVLAIAEESGFSLMIANERYADALRRAFANRGLQVTVVAVEAISELSADCPGDDLRLRLDSAQPAYVMYTSGTTGAPKCVAKQHVSVVNSITDLSERYGMTAAPGEERVILFSGCGFEPFMRQLLLALINSQILVIVPDDVRLDPQRFPEFLTRHKVTHLNGTGSVLRTFDLSCCPSLKRLALVGEELTTAVLRELRLGFGGTIINEYAFTEATFVTAIKEFGPGIGERIDRSIGRPLRNVTWYVLDKYRRQVPIGAIGELHVGGRGIADGYLNNDAMTADRFFENPFISGPNTHERGNGLLYNTGDLARMLPNGEVEFLGRRDFQLKLNGIRIEPGEIEARVVEYPGIQKCVVLPKNWPIRPGTSSLVGFYTVVPGGEIREPDLLSFLKTRLVPVMIPSRMIALDAFPVTSIGKVDWRALLSLASDGSQPGDRANVSRGDCKLRGVLWELWAEVLDLPGSGSDFGENDDFFRLGGQSISSIMLVARVRERLRRDIRVEDIFRLSTFDAIASFLEAQPELTVTGSDVGKPAQNSWSGSTQFAAHGLQQGLYYHALNAEAGDDTYIMQVVHRYWTPIRPDLMEFAWRQAYARFPALHLRFAFTEKPLQILDATPGPMDWRVIDVSGMGAEDALGALCHRERHEPFKLETGPLFRVRLVREAADRFALIFTCHHIMLDGWSLSILHEEVHRTYLDLLGGRSIRTDGETAFLAAQKHWEEHHHENRRFWTDQLDRIEGGCDLQGLLKLDVRGLTDLAGYTRVKRHETRQFRLDRETCESLRTRCADFGLTMHSALQFALHTALHAFGGGSQTVVGTIASGRVMPVPGIERAVGLLINTLPIIFDHRSSDADRTVMEAMADIQRWSTALNDRSVVNFAELESAGPKGRIFDALLMYENHPGTADDLRHREMLKFERSRDINKVDHHLQMVAREVDEGLEVCLWYAGELFDEAMIGRFMDTVATVLKQVAEDTSRTLSDLCLVDDDTLRVFDRWNDTKRDFDRQATLIDVFEEAAELWADEAALLFRASKLSYKELDERANRLAQMIASRLQPAPDDLIAIVMDKSDWLIATILAVWKTGAAYVPIDPGYPDGRIRFILGDTAARLVVADPEHRDRLHSLRGSGPMALSFDLIAPQEAPLEAYPDERPERTVGGDDLAYAIYTSGTTGQPKAVLVEHRGVVNLRHWLTDRFSLDRHGGPHVFLSFSNFVFDHFVEQMTDALLNGQTLVVLDDDLRTDNEALRACIRENGVTYLSGTPSVLSMYDYSACPSLRYIDAIGEDFSRPVFERIRRSFNGTIINGYGPTEISITSHKRPYGATEARDDKSIGVPVANTTCYILDSLMRRIPIGGIGELYIGGTGVTRGYLNRDDLTAERFIPDGFAGDSNAGERGSRLYRTGDLCRWLPNGEIEYFGRVDAQVKINGQRIEPAEVEGALLNHPDVEQAVVTVRGRASGEGSPPERKYLAAFYVAAREIGADELMAWLRDRLPAALIPARFTRIDRVPVTPSGKLDVRLLPEQVFLEDSCGTVPKTRLERDLRRIWSEVLGCEASGIGTDDNFFALGGDSLRAIKLAANVTSRLSRRLSLPAVFEYVTIEAQAHHLGSLETGAPPDTERDLTAAPARPPISSGQAALLYMGEFFRGTSAFNIPLFLAVDIRHVSGDAVASAMRFLVRRHEALRTLIRREPDGARTQDVLVPGEAIERLTLDVERLEHRRDLDRRCRDMADHVFELESELPVAVRLFSIDDDPITLYLGIIFHHACFDGWSLAIFRRELHHLVAGGQPGQLPLPSGSYCEFAIWERRQIDEGGFDPSIKFWRERLSGLPLLDLPTDRPRPGVFDHRGFETRFSLPPDIGNDLKVLARSAGVSLYTVLLAASAILLNTYSGQEDLAIGTPAANRIDTRFDDVIGLFANLIVLRIGVEDDMRLDIYLRLVADRVAEAQSHQGPPFDRIVKALGVEPEASRHSLFQALVTLAPPGTEESMPAGPLRDYRPDLEGRTSAKFDFSLAFADINEGLNCTLTLPTALYEPESAAAFIATFETIARDMAKVATAPDSVTIGSIRRLDETVYSRRRRSIERVTPELAEGLAAGARSLPELFETIVEAHRTSTAIACEDRQLTYADLNLVANRLANGLANTGSALGERIAIFMEKSEAVVISILAVWKAGGAYVPLDPAFPDDRINFILDDAGIGRILTDTRNAARAEHLADGRIPVVLASQTVSPAIGTPDLDIRRADPAYVIYTSGTSGKPKGVSISHGNLLSFQGGLARRHFGAADGTQQAILLTSNIVFDFSLEQLCLSILSGHRLVIEPSDILDDGAYDRLNSHGLSYLSGTPTQIERYDLAKLNHLRWVLLAGEAVKPHDFDTIRMSFGGTILTAYGTTETTVYNTVRRFEAGEPFVNDLGTPLPNTRLAVLDDRMRAVPDGACGQLFIMGPCVGLGYLNRPELNAGRFGRDLIGTWDDEEADRGGRFFATGDLVRRHPSGSLEFRGRNDAQVKIDGVRIEPGEIEATLSSLPGIGQSAVLPVARADGRQQLVAYIVANGGVVLKPEEIEKQLRKSLPRAMVPAHFVQIPGSFPMTVNGKLDVAALPRPEDYCNRSTHEPPRNLREAQLCELFSELLGGRDVGIDDDFFKSGGDSISALQLAARLRGHFGPAVDVRWVFDHPTVRRLSAFAICQSTVPASDTPAPGDVCESTTSDRVRPTPIQEWFLSKKVGMPSFWNQEFAFRTPILDLVRLRAALDRLTERHGAFELRFIKSDADGASAATAMVVGASEPINLHEVDVRDMPRETLRARLDALQGAFDLASGPLATAAYFHGFEDGSARVWFAMHHLIVDRVSWSILLDDLEALYHGNDLVLTGTSFRQWARAVREYLPGPGETRLWERVAQEVSGQRLVLRPVGSDGSTKALRFETPATWAHGLWALAARPGAPEFRDLLLAAVGVAVCDIAGLGHTYIAVENHGREAFDPQIDVSRTIGWFTTIHPVRVEASHPLESAVRLNEWRRQVPYNGLGYGTRGVLGGPEAPLPPLSVNYLGRLSTNGDGARWMIDPDMVDLVKAPEDRRRTPGTVDLTIWLAGGKLVLLMESGLSDDDAARLFERMKETLGLLSECRPSTLTAVTAKSATGCEDRVGPDFDPMIVIEKDPQAPCLYILPPGEGGAESYLGNLSPRLGDLNHVLFNNIHLVHPRTSFEEVGSYYLDLIRGRQKAGPYHLMGWSFGGTAALELALRLARDGQRVENLILIDPLLRLDLAEREIALADISRLIDPINLYYVPSPDDLERLTRSVGRVTLYKAGIGLRDEANDDRRRLFDYYAASTHNNLDTLMPRCVISVHSLGMSNHFSWVSDEALVARMGAEIRNLIRPNSNKQGEDRHERPTDPCAENRHRCPSGR